MLEKFGGEVIRSVETKRPPEGVGGELDRELLRTVTKGIETLVAEHGRMHNNTHLEELFEGLSVAGQRGADDSSKRNILADIRDYLELQQVEGTGELVQQLNTLAPKEGGLIPGIEDQRE